jgi:predicted secreted hydrolase
MTFTLTPTQPLLLQGEGRYSRKGHGPELASYYVSWPQLQVAGTLVQRRSPQAVAGRAWFDHEWSTALLGDGAVGWDWLGINLADGGALMAFRMRDAAGGDAVRACHLARRCRPPAPVRSRRHPLHAAAPVGVAAQWRRYPVQMEIRSANSHGADAAGARRSGTDHQPAGTCGLLGGRGQGRRARLSGRGYLEMTGYAGRLRV